MPNLREQTVSALPNFFKRATVANKMGDVCALGGSDDSCNGRTRHGKNDFFSLNGIEHVLNLFHPNLMHKLKFFKKTKRLGIFNGAGSVKIKGDAVKTKPVKQLNMSVQNAVVAPHVVNENNGWCHPE